MSKEYEEGYCSKCFEYTKHKLVQKNYIRRNVYKCTNCEASTLMCRLCNNFANSSKNWDDEFCAKHSGIISSFEMHNYKLNNVDALSKVKGLEIKKIKDGEGPDIIFIDGFLTQGTDDITDWERELNILYPNNPFYYVTWESKRLFDLGKNYILMGHYGSLHTWLITSKKAEKTGFLLANILAKKDKEYILCGHSLGARVIYYTLNALVAKEKKFINTVHLLGGAIGSDEKNWEIVKTAVINKINNYKSDNDYVLASLYKVGMLFMSNPIGRNSINVKGINNIDTSDIVEGHDEYKKFFSSFANV